MSNAGFYDSVRVREGGAEIKPCTEGLRIYAVLFLTRRMS